eukprot:1644498-Rhodomonas_salina.3
MSPLPCTCTRGSPSRLETASRSVVDHLLRADRFWFQELAHSNTVTEQKKQHSKTKQPETLEHRTWVLVPGDCSRGNSQSDDEGVQVY